MNPRRRFYGSLLHENGEQTNGYFSCHYMENIEETLEILPYRMHISHQLLSSDYSERMHFAEWCLETFDSNPVKTVSHQFL